MPRHDVNAESREGLLHSEHTYPLQSDRPRSSTDSDEPLDSLDLNAADRAKYEEQQRWSCIPKRPPWASGYTYEEAQDKSMRRPARHKGIKAVFVQWKTCSIIVLILALALILLMGSGALWVYKAVPKDGVSAFPCGVVETIGLHVPIAITTLVSNPSGRDGSRMAREL